MGPGSCARLGLISSSDPGTMCSQLVCVARFVKCFKGASVSKQIFSSTYVSRRQLPYSVTRHHSLVESNATTHPAAPPWDEDPGGTPCPTRLECTIPSNISKGVVRGMRSKGHQSANCTRCTTRKRIQTRQRFKQNIFQYVVAFNRFPRRQLPHPVIRRHSLVESLAATTPATLP